MTPNAEDSQEARGTVCVNKGRREDTGDRDALGTALDIG
jgi:hypothetical protein